MKELKLGLELESICAHVCVVIEGGGGVSRRDHHLNSQQSNELQDAVVLAGQAHQDKAIKTRGSGLVLLDKSDD